MYYSRKQITDYLTFIPKKETWYKAIADNLNKNNIVEHIKNIILLENNPAKALRVGLCGYKTKKEQEEVLDEMIINHYQLFPVSYLIKFLMLTIGESDRESDREDGLLDKVVNILAAITIREIEPCK